MLAALRRQRTTTLTVLIAAVLAANGGALVAHLTPVEEPVQAAPAPVVEPDRTHLAPLGGVGARLVGELRAALPVREPTPANARAATPEVRHGQLEIPSIGLSQPFFEGVTLTAIDRGPSHWPGTAMPGDLGNVVIAGHRTTRTRPFWDLDLVQAGDELIFTMSDGTRHVYTLDHTQVVDDQDIWVTDQAYGYTATLFGCHPKGSARQRIVGFFTWRSTTPPPPPAAP